LKNQFNKYLHRLIPICRSLTGNGNRETLSILNEITNIKICEVSTGTSVYDWVVPEEWIVNDAYIATENGTRIVDYKFNNLHLVSYSEPINEQLSWFQLKDNIHVHPDIPNAIPYRTSYYERNWGFCVTADQYSQLKDTSGLFHVVIDSEFIDGSMTYGEVLLPGISQKEILISSYICHPSMANDSLSGVILTAFLAKKIAAIKERKWSYRIIFVPETLGAVAYCALNENIMKKIDMGLVVTTVGGPGLLGYKQSWQSDHPINRLIEECFLDLKVKYKTYEFDVHGSDERQFSSQGFRINCATICKNKYYEYPQYHSSLDNESFVNGKQIYECYNVYERLIDKLESRIIYKNTTPNCEVMLSKYNLYPKTGGSQCPSSENFTELDIILWLLFLCDGNMSISDIAKKLDIDEKFLQPALVKLTKNKLLKRI
jgi:aminopeptidase-like protein